MVTFLGLHKGGEGSEGFDQYRRKKSWSLFHLCGHFLGVAQGGGDPLGGGGSTSILFINNNHCRHHHQTARYKCLILSINSSVPVDLLLRKGHMDSSSSAIKNAAAFSLSNGVMNCGLPFKVDCLSTSSLLSRMKNAALRSW